MADDKVSGSEVMEVETLTGHECIITLVAPGRSDSLIKVYPAEHKEEKIWLDNTPGIERWDMIKRMMQLHASRFSPIAEPIPYCSDTKDLKTITLRQSDIPVVKLENFVLPAPAMEEKIEYDKTQLTEKQWDDRITGIENLVKKLAETIMAGKDDSEDEAIKRGPGRPRKQ